MSGDAISISLLEVPQASGGMAQRVRAFDWASTPLGPMAQWPAALRIAVGICLNSRFPMFVWWGPQYINIYNDAYVPMLGERHPRALGRPARDSWDDIWDIVGAQADRVTRSGEATWNDCVKLVMHRHGYEEETWFTWSYSPIYDESGSIGGMFCAVTEETARVIAERERDALLARVESERTRLAHAFAHSPALVAVLKGREHVFEFANARYLELVGGRDIVGKPLAEALPEVVGQGFVALMDGVYATGEPYVGSGERITLHRSANAQPEDVFLDFVYQPMRDAEGAVQGVLVHGVDVTSRHASLEAEQHARSEAELGNRMKDEFLATLSHELRTPLNAILGWSHMLRQNMTPEQVARGADVIERNARAQLRIIEDLLDMSAIMSGKVRLDSEQIAVGDIARAAIESMRPAAQAKRVALDVDPAGGGGAVILGDANRLQQVLWNLLSNAVKFTPAGGRVTLRIHKPDPAHVEVCVADSGEGIAPEFLPYVFDRFRQADASTTRRHGGLGLGLAIVKQLVELHGGRVRVESAGAGRGAAFFVALPVIDAARGAVAGGAKHQHWEAKAAASRIAIAGLRVLIVDDDRDGRELVQRLLEECHARVTAAGSSAHALRLLGESQFDVLVSDIGMPDEDGYEMMRKIRALPDEKGGSIPALALTAYTRPEDRVKAIRAGFQLHAAKPVDPVELLVLVESLVSRRG